MRHSASGQPGSSLDMEEMFPDSLLSLEQASP